MKAAQINEYGDVSVVHILDTKKPVIDSSQVLVKVAAASLNPFDTTIRSPRTGSVKGKIVLTIG